MAVTCEFGPVQAEAYVLHLEPAQDSSPPRHIPVAPFLRPHELPPLPDIEESMTFGAVVSADRCQRRTPVEDEPGCYTRDSEEGSRGGCGVATLSDDLTSDNAHDAEKPVSIYGCAVLCEEPYSYEDMIASASTPRRLPRPQRPQRPHLSSQGRGAMLPLDTLYRSSSDGPSLVFAWDGQSLASGILFMGQDKNTALSNDALGDYAGDDLTLTRAKDLPAVEHIVPSTSPSTGADDGVTDFASPFETQDGM